MRRVGAYECSMRAASFASTGLPAWLCCIGETEEEEDSCACPAFGDSKRTAPCPL